MDRVAVFEKVSYKQYREDYMKCVGKPFIDEETEEALRKEYEEIKLPTRATAGSAGYDFYIPYGRSFRQNNNKLIPTGIRCKMKPGWVLMLFPKSGLGTKYGMRLLNSTGIVDQDFAFSSNEGHIMAMLTVGRDLTMNAGDKFIQGVFLPYGITEDDNASGIRDGGFGSTGA